MVPDIITLAKGLGSGLPISAVLARDEIMSWPPGSHGSTFGGNPVACVAALETINLVEEGLMNNAVEIGSYLIEGLYELQSRHPFISDVRGKGLMLAIEFTPGELATLFERACFEKGLLVLTCGENSVRFAPPMILERADVDKALELVANVLSELSLS